MANNDQIVQRWADVATGKETRNYARQRNVYAEGDSLYSYGDHFEVARAMRTRGKVTWFLLNGDIWRAGGWHAGSTSLHQQLARDVVKSTGLPALTVPFSALNAAGIVYDSIRIVESLPESYETTQHHAATLEEVPAAYRPRRVTDNTDAWDRHREGEWSRYSEAGNRAAVQDVGGWAWETYRHWLGSAVFNARYRVRRDATRAERAREAYPWRTVTRRACFLSAFDEQEPRPLYFLAQLPRGAKPGSYAEAIECLKPAMVRDAEAAGAGVLRQGDVFAITEPNASTRELHAMAPSARGAYVLGVNHTATESVTASDGATFARGALRHAPRGWGRRPEHRRVKLGDGKTWHRLARNTVPDGRSWSMAGNVD